MNRIGRIPKKHIDELSDDEEELNDNRNNQQLQRKRRNTDNQPTQNITTPTPDNNTQNYNNNNDDDGYVRGSIVRIKLNNFVTYSDVEFRPGPRLNVLIGPNGSGKSSIVCAIALGLGGSPNLLGRQKQISDFVKRGTTQGYVEIELYNPDGDNYVIKRDLKKENNSADFRLNGRPITKADLLAKIKELNIQVENLCQFLPQDKVVGFASMSPTELLLETEKAIGVDNMYENHQELIKLRSDSSKDTDNLEQQRQQLENLKDLNKGLEKDVERFREREKILEIINLYRQKRAWAIFETLRTEGKRLKDEKDKSEAELREARNQLAPLQTSIMAQEQSLKKSRQESDQLDKKILQLNKEVGISHDTAEKCSIQIESFIKELDSLNDREAKRKRQIEQAQQLIQQLKAELDQLPPEEQDKQRIQEINANAKEQNTKLAEISVEIQSQQQQLQRYNADCQKYSKDLERFKNIKNQKIETLRKEAYDVYQAYLWVQENQSKFEKPVFGPIMLEVNCPNPEHAVFLETALSWNLLVSFVFQTNNDRNLFHKALTDGINGGRKLRLSSILVPNVIPTKHQVDLAAFAQYGATGFLDEVFQADPIVKSAINDSTPIFKTLVFNKNIIGKEDEVLNKILSFCTPQAQYLTTFSKYGDRASMTRVISLKPAKFLGGFDQSRKVELEKQLEESIGKLNELKQQVAQLRQTEREFTNLLKELSNERQELNGNIEKRRKLLSRIQIQIRALEDLKHEEDIESESNKIKSNILKTYERKIQLHNQATQALIELMKSSGAKDHCTISSSRFEAKLNSEKGKLEEEKQKIQVFAERVAEIQKEAERTLKEMRLKRQEAERIAPFSEELKQKFEEIKGQTIQEIDDEVRVLETKEKFLVSSNPRVVYEYEQRRQEIEDLEAKLQDSERIAESNNNRLVTLKKKWLEPITDYINQINERFSLFFKEIRCEGKVVLGFDPKDENDFSKYRIDLQVRFREETSLKNLNAQLQSGGERSVSTMLFLISLQNLTKCPFRVVDEINQGMDPKNERMVFEQIVKTVSKPDLPQYFLITPKLLHNLPYSRETTVLCVLTGPWFLSQSEWDGFLQYYLSKRKQNTTTTTTTTTNTNSRIEEEEDIIDE